MNKELKEDAIETIGSIMAFHNLSDEEWDGLSRGQKLILAEEAEEDLPEGSLFESSNFRIDLAPPWS